MADDDYEIKKIPLSIFIDNLDFDQEKTLMTIQEAMDRGSNYANELVEGNEELQHEFEPLHRLLTGITTAAIVPIVHLINDHNVHPEDAIRGVMAGVGAMFFFGGIEYAKMLGLDGVGVDIRKRHLEKDDDEESKNYYPENKSEGATGSLEEALRKFKEENPDLEDDSE